MPAYYYSSTAGSYTLTGDVTPSVAILVLNTVSGLPSSTPYKVVVDAGQPSEEIVKVTAVAGTSLTVVRGWDGTGAQSHAAGANVRHMVTAEDFSLSRAHEDSSAAHGATGAVVGTTNAQTISNKDLSDGTNTFPSALATTTGSQALTNKDLSTGNVFPASLATLTDVQTLTNKTLDGAGNTFANIPQASVTGLPTSLTTLGTRATALETATADTGWVNFDVTGDFTGLRRIRKQGRMVWFKLALARSGSGWNADYDILTGISSTYMPTDNGGSIYPVGTILVNGSTLLRTRLDGSAKKLILESLTIAVGGNVTGTVCWPLD